MPNPFITPEYVVEQINLHKDPAYGSGSHRHAPLIAGLAIIENCKSVLDYGCGKGTLIQQFNKIYNPPFSYEEYDPGVPGKDIRPDHDFDLVACLDVMEHIEPPFLDNVIMDLAWYARKLVFVDISTKFTKSRWLSDGRNSHLIVNEPDWWEKKFSEKGFKVLRVWNTGVRAWVALMRPTKVNK